jgi:benzoyl-CoA reductase/2-hydroxyglutaryl-CoA dehydratase subunit BcrC/BadD/HgdB
MTEYQLNRLETTRLMGPLVDGFWERLRHAHDDGMSVAWCVGPLFMIPMAAGCRTHFHAGYCSYVAGRRAAPEMLEAAERDGHPTEMCSYIKLHTGLIAMEQQSLPIRDDIRLPRPDVIFLGRYCQEQSHLADILYRRTGAPIVTVDLPPAPSDEDIPSLVTYVERQIREEAIPALESIFGRPYEYDRLSQIIADLKSCAELRDECIELGKHKPSPWTLTDMCVSIAPVMYMMGEPGTVEYYAALRAELQDRVNQNVPAVLPEEKYRLYYDHYIMWGWLGPLSRKIASYGGNMVVGRYPFGMIPAPQHLDPSDPVHTLAEQLVRWMMSLNAPQAGVKKIMEWVQDYEIDGLVMLSSPTCRMFVAQPDILDIVERQCGIPGILLEADMIDPKFYNEAQIDTRLQALFEMMESRRRLRG